MNKLKNTKDGSVLYIQPNLNLIDFGFNPEDFTPMTEAEIIFHESVQPSQYHVWDEGNLKWIDPRTDEEILEQQRSLMPTLSMREFRKILRDNNLFDVAENYVKESGDGYLEDAWYYADFFARLDPFVISASQALGLTPEQVDELWKN